MHEEPTLDKPSKSPEKTTLERERRVIKRYSNRKLYDTRDSRYVTLLQIAEMIRAGEDVQIIDNASKEDKTEVTLALIISEELKSQPRSVPLVTLRNLIHQRGERLLSQLREGPIGRLIPGVTEIKTPQDGVAEGSATDPSAVPAQEPPSLDVVQTTPQPEEDAGPTTVRLAEATGDGGPTARERATPVESVPVDQEFARRVGQAIETSEAVRALRAEAERLASRIAALEEKVGEHAQPGLPSKRGEDPP